eukprot:344338-Amphidinium_carterae.1
MSCWATKGWCEGIAETVNPMAEIIKYIRGAGKTAKAFPSFFSTSFAYAHSTWSSPSRLHCKRLQTLELCHHFNLHPALHWHS